MTSNKTLEITSSYTPKAPTGVLAHAVQESPPPNSFYSVVRNNPDLFFHLVANDARQLVPPSPWTNGPMPRLV